MSEVPVRSAIHDDAHVDDRSPRRRLLDSAREEIVCSGILGLRVADVAARANYSVSAIYRYFGDRDGLLAEVLDELYGEILARRFDAIAAAIPAEGELTIDDLLALVPMPQASQRDGDVRIRLQILAVAATNPALEARLAARVRAGFMAIRSAVEHLRARMAPGVELDERFFTMVVVNQLFYYNSLLGDLAIDDDAYRDFVRSVVVKRARD